jgi:hypothetical protein
MKGKNEGKTSDKIFAKSDKWGRNLNVNDNGLSGYELVLCCHNDSFSK